MRLSAIVRRTTLPGTDIETSRIGFGTGSLHHLYSRRQRQTLLHEALSGGITHFDTSPFYGLGLAERDLGAFLRGRRDQVTVTTKIGLYPFGPAAGSTVDMIARKAAGRLFSALSRPVGDWSVGRAKRSLDQSLRRLGTEHVDMLLIHEPPPDLLGDPRLEQWLESERRAGRIRAYGIAGTADRCAPFVAANASVARLVQTADGLDRREADFLIGAGRDLQITYGYLKSMMDSDPEATLRTALRRNAHGMILISTRHRDRLRSLARVAR